MKAEKIQLNNECYSLNTGRPCDEATQSAATLSNRAMGHNKISFGWTIPLNNAEKKCGLETHRFSSRMNGYSEYDVYIKPIKSKTIRERELGCMGPLIYGALAVLGGVGCVLGANEFTLSVLNLPVDSILRPVIGIPSAIIGGIGAISSVMFKRVHDFSVMAATHRSESKDADGNPKPAGIITKEYIVKNNSGRYNPSIDFSGEIRKLKQEKFNDFIKHYDTNDLFQSKNYARILKNRPKELNGAEFFSYKIDDKGNTLLTAFFDVVPDNELYPKIIEYLQHQPNLDFNQKDGNGISCIEKVLISENKEVLNLILNAKYTRAFGKPFGWISDAYDDYLIEDIETKNIHNPSKIPYSPEFDDIYSNIQDEEFKKMVDDNIQWDFSNWIAVIQSHDVSKAEKLKKRFNSPLLDKQQIYEDINKALSNCHDMNFITYMQTNFLKELMNIKREK